MSGEAVLRGLRPHVRAAVEAALGELERRGARLQSLELPLTALSIPTYYVLATAEASSNLGRYDGVRYGLRRGGERSLAEMFAATRAAGFGREVERRILLGTFVLSRG
ncbi:MAG TPA: amidase family protein, partial [Solirubrobacterales bacterium]|nr:amidase family protein [Solirubrobacterales bacterium]